MLWILLRYELRRVFRPGTLLLAALLVPFAAMLAHVSMAVSGAVVILPLLGFLGAVAGGVLADEPTVEGYPARSYVVTRPVAREQLARARLIAIAAHGGLVFLVLSVGFAATVDLGQLGGGMRLATYSQAADFEQAGAELVFDDENSARCHRVWTRVPTGDTGGCRGTPTMARIRGVHPWLAGCLFCWTGELLGALGAMGRAIRLPRVGSNGGALGWLAKGRMTLPLLAAATLLGVLLWPVARQPAVAAVVGWMQRPWELVVVAASGIGLGVVAVMAAWRSGELRIDGDR